MVERWNQHLLSRISALEAEIHKLRKALSRERNRAELWRKRALEKKGTRT